MQDAEQVVESNSNHKDLTIEWYLPSIVRHERQYQMKLAASRLLREVAKVEDLLGHGLNINEEILND